MSWHLFSAAVPRWASALTLMVLCHSAGAATITVTSLADTVNAGDGLTTLREAIAQANAAPGADVIQFAVTGQILLVDANALPIITTEVTIEGPSLPDRIEIRRSSAAPHYRVIAIAPGATGILRRLTIAGGHAAPLTNGGGVLNQGTLTIDTCEVRDNQTDMGQLGGGVASGNSPSAQLTMMNSTVANNLGGQGGGVYVFDTAPTTIRNSTISSNTGATGGGLRVMSQDVIITNCTIAFNTATTNNTANAGGILSQRGLRLKNNIVANNNGGTGTSNASNIRNVQPPLYISDGYNLIGPNAGGNLPAAQPTDIYDSNPLLMPLANYRGFGRTHALPLSSPAVDKAAAEPGIIADQRGAFRPFDQPSIPPASGGNNSDIGSVERTGDIDNDTVEDFIDNCLGTPNPDQADVDGDGVGNVCDNCPTISNPPVVRGEGTPLQPDIDEDGIGDACDNCPFNPNPGQEDVDNDGIGDICDNCVNIANPGQEDINFNGIGDACEPMPPVALADAYATPEDTTLNVNAVAGVLANDSDPNPGDTLSAILVATTTSGSLALNANGSFTYIPNLNFFGVDSFTYRASDPGGLLSGITTATITVTPVNDAPIANNDSFTTPEDIQLVVNVPGILGNDTDIDGPFPLTTLQITGPSNGVLALNTNGSFTYTPNLNYNGPDSFTYRARDGSNLQSNIATVSITVSPVNDNPVAVNDAFSTPEDTQLVIAAPGVLGNDTDVDGPLPLSAILASSPTNGVLSLNANGSFTYTPAANYNGPDSFTYRARDGANAESNIATVSINVTPVNDPPIAANDAYATDENVTLNVSAALGVLANDTDIDGPLPLNALQVSPATSGAATLGANGSFVYVPAPGFNGIATFTYRARDNANAQSNIATVTITVGPVNDPPLAVNDAYSVNEDTGLSVNAASGVLANDTDPDGPFPLTAELISGPSNGILTALNANGSFSYTPGANFVGGDSFTYRARDGAGLASQPATVTITVLSINDPPVAVDDAFATPEDTQLVIAAPGVLANDTDPDGPMPVAALLTVSPASGTLSLNLDGSFTYTPNANFSGVDSFRYRARDATNLQSVNTALVTITVTPVNDAPVALNDAFSTPEDTQLVIAAPGILGNDSDIDGPLPLTSILVSTTTNGSLVLNANGSFTYTPNSNYFGPDAFTYRARDGASAVSNIATVSINVGPVNDLPVAVNDAFSTPEDTQLVITPPGILANDTDPDGPLPLTSILVSTTTNGSLVLNANGSFTYTPNSNYFGPDAFTYRARDGSGGESNTATVSITVTPVNDLPVAVNDAFSTPEDTQLVIAAPGILANDSDVDGPLPLTTVIMSSTTSGTLSLNPDGSFTYTPNANYFGPDAFTYRARDGAGAESNTATVSITVVPANDAPVAVNDAFSTPEDTQLVIAAPGILANDSDVDGPLPLTSILVSTPTNGTLALGANGSFVYTPAPNYFGPDSFTYRARDGSGLESGIATVSITVTPVNDLPVAVNDTYTVRNVDVLTVASPGVLANDTDVDGPLPLTAEQVTGVAVGTLSFNANGSLTYTPPAAFVGPVVFTYRARDGAGGGSNTATVTINVTPTNRPPDARCRDVLIDARTTCPPSFNITIDDVNNGSTDPDIASGDSITLSISSLGPFPIGETDVTLTATDSFGLTDSCIATVTVLAEDCNANGIPDSCEIQDGSASDCNNDGIPDECNCIWDNGDAININVNPDGQLSHLGGGAPEGGKSADDFFLLEGMVHRLTAFSGQMLTNSWPGLRRAKLELYNDCNGKPEAIPFKTFDEFTIVGQTPAPGGFVLITYRFDLCEEELWLDGGKTYWLSLIGLADRVTDDLSFWAVSGDPQQHNPIAANVPCKARGLPGGNWDEFEFDAWDSIAECCVGCVGFAFKLEGQSCKVLVDNGGPDLGMGRGGTPSGVHREQTTEAVDSFTLPPCKDDPICFIEGYIWSNCNPLDGFIQIFENDCNLPGHLVYTATPTKVERLDDTWTPGAYTYHLYRVQLCGINLRLPAGRNYWIQFGAYSGGNFSTSAYFAHSTTDCEDCSAPRGSQGLGRIIAPIADAEWTPQGRDFAFRVAVHQPVLSQIVGGPFSSPESCIGDADGSGDATVADIFTFLSAWFAGCP